MQELAYEYTKYSLCNINILAWFYFVGMAEVIVGEVMEVAVEVEAMVVVVGEAIAEEVVVVRMVENLVDQEVGMVVGAVTLADQGGMVVIEWTETVVQEKIYVNQGGIRNDFNRSKRTSTDLLLQYVVGMYQMYHSSIDLAS